IELTFGKHIVPGFVVNRRSHFGRVAKVQVIRALVVLTRPKILRIVHVGIMVKAVPVLSVVVSAPLSTKSLLCLRLRGGQRGRYAQGADERQESFADHGNSPPREAKC